MSRRDIFCQKRNLAYSAQIGFDLLNIGYNGWKQVVENRLMFISYRVYQALAATTCLTVLSVYLLVFGYSVRRYRSNLRSIEGNIVQTMTCPYPAAAGGSMLMQRAPQADSP